MKTWEREPRRKATNSHLVEADGAARRIHRVAQRGACRCRAVELQGLPGPIPATPEPFKFLQRAVESDSLAKAQIPQPDSWAFSK